MAKTANKNASKSNCTPEFKARKRMTLLEYLGDPKKESSVTDSLSGNEKSNL